MKFESGERREGVEEGEGAGHNFSEVEKTTSEKRKKQLLRHILHFSFSIQTKTTNYKRIT